ncbi:hypothetical protein [Oceanispirochaeta sp.]|jgi:hypothetical protein|nr:hypothetical protein [Oceanispirochaeta sp.]MDA3955803.1 hypothetical protein [Oceanispirochaeta sp.]
MKTSENLESLSREIQIMPDIVHSVLKDQDLITAYKNRPPYQQND